MQTKQQALILIHTQAQAVYSAMRALDNVRGRLDIVMRGVRVKEYANYVILITSKGVNEDHSNQAAFAAAYGLRPAPDAAPLLEALQSLDREGWLSNIERQAQSAGNCQLASEVLAHMRKVRAAIAQATA